MKRIISVVLLFVLIISLAAIPERYVLAATKVTVDRVVDGDTFIYYDGDEQIRVRMIGVDTPESVHPDASHNTAWGKKISKWVKKKLTGKKVRLEYDVDQYDQYGRVLAYVFLGKKMFQKKLLKKGFARAVYYAPNGKFRDVFFKLQTWAMNHNKGFWKDGYEVAFPTA